MLQGERHAALQVLLRQADELQHAKQKITASCSCSAPQIAAGRTGGGGASGRASDSEALKPVSVRPRRVQR